MGEIPGWLKSDLQKLSQQASEERLPHGLLLVGHPGDGASLFASALAKRLLCLNPGIEACGQCKSCQLVQSSLHPDFQNVEPEGKSQTIKVDAIRRLISKITETAQQGGNKVVHIKHAQNMNVNAANALLKVLEEPTDKTFILLEADSISRMLPTIRSRCRIIHLASPTPDQSSAFMREAGCSKSTQKRLEIAAGRPLLAAELADERLARWAENEEYFYKKQSFSELSAYLAKAPMDEVLPQAMLWIDSALRKQQNPEFALASVSEGLLKSLASLNNVSLFQFRDYIVEKLSAVQRQANLNAQLMAEELTHQWFQLRGRG